MIDARLPLALKSGLDLPASGLMLVINPPVDAALEGVDRQRVEIVTDFKPDADAWRARGYAVATRSDARCAAALLCLPRSKTLARALVAQAMAQTDGVVIVDGQKTDGADSILREVRKRTPVSGQISKAHGKLFWLAAQAGVFDDWAMGPARTAGGFWTAPGVFSADGIDPASDALAALLPRSLGAHVADFGAGWGFLAAHILTRDGVERVDLVEAGFTALECARRNVTDPRARFHWADATRWQADGRLDAVVMNPPFHQGRTAEPALGQAFIAAAARALGPKGDLWMVANRHLPYETTLEQRFASVVPVGEDNRFKVIHASRPKRSASAA